MQVKRRSSMEVLLRPFRSDWYLHTIWSCVVYLLSNENICHVRCWALRASQGSVTNCLGAITVIPSHPLSSPWNKNSDAVIFNLLVPKIQNPNAYESYLLIGWVHTHICFIHDDTLFMRSIWVFFLIFFYFFLFFLILALLRRKKYSVIFFEIYSQRPDVKVPNSNRQVSPTHRIHNSTPASLLSLWSMKVFVKWQCGNRKRAWGYYYNLST